MALTKCAHCGQGHICHVPATAERLRRELADRDAALARVTALCDGWIDLESADRVRAAMKGTP